MLALEITTNSARSYMTAIGLLLCTAALNLAHGQTLQSDQFSVTPGDVFEFGTIPWTEPGPAGTDQNWDLSSASTPFTFNYNWQAPSSLDLVNHPSCTVVREPYFSCTEYWEATPQRFSELSNFCGIDLSFARFDDPRDIIRYPFTLGNSLTDSFGGAARLQGSSDTVSFTGTITVTADATGSLTLPWTNFPSVLRLRVDQEMNYPELARTDHERQTWYVVAGVHMPAAAYSERWSTGVSDTIRSARILTGTNTAAIELASTHGPTVRQDGRHLVLTTSQGIPLRDCDLLLLDGRLLGSWRFTEGGSQWSIPLDVSAPVLVIIRATDTHGRLYTARVLATP